MPAGSGACKVEIADITGDGLNDIIAANFHDNTISVIEQKPGGALAEEAVVYKLAGSRPNGMAIGDINGDGLNDIVTANRDSDTIDIFFQKNGRLEIVKSIVVTDDEVKAFGPVETVIADLNNDGLNDIAFTHMRSNTVRVIYQVLPYAPEISSSTHPSQESWYPEKSPAFILAAREDLNGIKGFLYSITKDSPAFDAGSAVFSESPSVRTGTLEAGTWYFSAAVKDSAGNISEPAVYKVNINEEMSEKNVYNYPNPASDFTTIRFPLTERAEVKLVVRDINGAVVWTKIIGTEEAVPGINNIRWNLVNDRGRQIANGVYMLTVISGDKVITKKIAVVR